MKYLGSLTASEQSEVKEMSRYYNDQEIADYLKTTIHKVRNYRVEHLKILRPSPDMSRSRMRYDRLLDLKSELKALELFSHKFPSFLASANHRIEFLNKQISNLSIANEIY